jgi:prepilin-type N-terminal cleavage/methylation domain-containing protein
MKRDRGFTLIELAVVVAIFGLLLTILVVPLSTQFDQQRAAETQKQLENVREALIGFAIANGRLPCPANATIAAGTANAGTENRVGAACAAAQGTLPWAALGVPETDAWGRRFTYRITLTFADDPAVGMQASFLITDTADITLTDGTGPIASALPAMVVSHGKNGLGAYQTNGIQIAGPAGDESENSDNDVNFVSRPHAPDFDDQLAWVSSNVLKSRMVASNRLP